MGVTAVVTGSRQDHDRIVTRSLRRFSLRRCRKTPEIWGRAPGSGNPLKPGRKSPSLTASQRGSSPVRPQEISMLQCFMLARLGGHLGQSSYCRGQPRQGAKGPLAESGKTRGHVPWGGLRTDGADRGALGKSVSGSRTWVSYRTLRGWTCAARAGSSDAGCAVAFGAGLRAGVRRKAGQAPRGRSSRDRQGESRVGSYGQGPFGAPRSREDVRLMRRPRLSTWRLLLARISASQRKRKGGASQSHPRPPDMRPRLRTCATFPTASGHGLQHYLAVRPISGGLFGIPATCCGRGRSA